MRYNEEKKIMFKIGDKVKIVKKVEEITEDFNNLWLDEMDASIGTIGTIIGICHSGVLLEESAYTYPPASLVLVKEEKVKELVLEEREGFDSLSSLLRYLADGNIILDSTVQHLYKIEGNILKYKDIKDCLYKIDNNVLKYESTGNSGWIYCPTVFVDYSSYTKVGRLELFWYEKEFKPCLCYVWDKDEEQDNRIALVVEYDKYEDYPFQSYENCFHFAIPLTLAEVTMYCLGE